MKLPIVLNATRSAKSLFLIVVLKDIVDEGLVHVGEFLRLLHELAPGEEKYYAKGAKEVENMIKDLK
jgi:rubrerythrin